MRSKFKVTLYNQHAACGYSGEVKRTMPEAFRSARRKASEEFVLAGDDRARHGNDWQFRVLFEGARSALMFRKAHAATTGEGALSVRIERA